ncbi:hypothetical protein PLESTF_001126700 [Pleodorina starrii]|nr:hypothetical protein PLESTM_001295300 [Pleodorina starrii]GLC71484.1 hypothetical protein PLESTF_001126700 [Pleodorina starrii]
MGWVTAMQRRRSWCGCVWRCARGLSIHRLRYAGRGGSVQPAAAASGGFVSGCGADSCDRLTVQLGAVVAAFLPLHVWPALLGRLFGCHTLVGCHGLAAGWGRSRPAMCAAAW